MTALPIDMILLGLVMVAFIVATPICIGIVSVLLWGGRPKGRRTS